MPVIDTAFLFMSVLFRRFSYGVSAPVSSSHLLISTRHNLWSSTDMPNGKRKRPRARPANQVANPNLQQFTDRLSDLLRNLRQQGGKDLIADAIWELADEAELSWIDLKRRKCKLPSFSNASWKEVAPEFKLDPLRWFKQLDIFSFPIAPLPPSFHREVMKVSAKWLDVYQERDSHTREAARVRLMDAVCAFLVHS